MEYAVRPENPIIAGGFGEGKTILHWKKGDTFRRTFKVNIILKGDESKEYNIPENCSIKAELLRHYNGECVHHWCIFNVPITGEFTLELSKEESSEISSGLYDISIKLLGNNYIPKEEDFKDIIPDNNSISINNDLIDCSSTYIEWEPDEFIIKGILTPYELTPAEQTFEFGNRYTICLDIYVPNKYKEYMYNQKFERTGEQLKECRNGVDPNKLLQPIKDITPNNNPSFISYNLKENQVVKDTNIIVSDIPEDVENTFQPININGVIKTVFIKDGHTTIYISSDRTVTEFNINIVDNQYKLKVHEDVLVKTDLVLLHDDLQDIKVGECLEQLDNYDGSFQLVGNPDNVEDNISLLFNMHTNDILDKEINVYINNEDTPHIVKCLPDYCYAILNLNKYSMSPIYDLLFEFSCYTVKYRLDTTKFNNKVFVSKKPTDCDYVDRCKFNKDYKVCPYCKIKQDSYNFVFEKEIIGPRNTQKLVVVEE